MELTHRSPVFKRKYYLSSGNADSLISARDVLLNRAVAFDLLKSAAGKKVLEDHYKAFLSRAKAFEAGIIMESPTWRANCDWGIRLGYTHDELFALNKQSIKFLREVAAPFVEPVTDVIVSGNIGPRCERHDVNRLMNKEQARVYHLEQVKAFALGDADVVTAADICYPEEAIGIINAARTFNLPAVVCFAVKEDGNLPGGEPLAYTIGQVDKATQFYAEHYMIACADPQHLHKILQKRGDWKSRICGVYAGGYSAGNTLLAAPHAAGSSGQSQRRPAFEQLLKDLPSLKVVLG